MSTIIFEQSTEGRSAHAQIARPSAPDCDIPTSLLRQTPPRLPECSELQVVRHFTRLSQKNFSIDTNFYPLGSCTMKYNPRGVHAAASQTAFLDAHPLATSTANQGTLSALYHLQTYLTEITGMAAVSLTPMAGAQGEFAGVAMIKAYHEANGDFQRTEMLTPDAAHGTNPASAMTCEFKIIEIPTAKDGDIDLDVLRQRVGNKTAGIMLTNPSTLGLFMKKIKEIATIVHEAGGLLYYDGANLNAILGQVRPGDMGFDVMHLNLHKTFATPHGGGGPGSGPVAVNARLRPFLPLPFIIKDAQQYRLATSADCPSSIGRLSTFIGNTGILLRAYFYICVLGKQGLTRVSEYATLNANYLLAELTRIGFTAAYPKRRASHEFIITLAPEKKEYHIQAMDLAKRLLDYGFHAPTTYFPLLIPECLLIEPTETECKQILDTFVAAMQSILEEIKSTPNLLKTAPHTCPIKRLNELQAAKA
ncbi:MAG: aminomethyl-transferring glycine dehydrogenase subunit GcvPB, partial [Gammaproteobacteria bacterium]|nr:aminomethyl-transferring glycine dehydrogenase subunit GcvPB [Gammaproteobacteria bacterium]